MTTSAELLPISREEASRLTERIRLLTSSARDSLERLSALIAEARDRGAAEALGYRSWTEYVAAEFSDSPLQLDRDDRRELVVSLGAMGMSTRAIAPVVGSSKSQVAEDIATVQNRTDEPRAVESIDGRTRTYAPRASMSTASAPPRRPLPDQFRDAVVELVKAAERVERLTEDDRFSANKEQVAGIYHSDLLRVTDALGRVRDRFNN